MDNDKPGHATLLYYPEEHCTWAICALSTPIGHWRDNQTSSPDSGLTNGDVEQYRNPVRIPTDSQLGYQCTCTRGEIREAASAASAPEGGKREFQAPHQVRPNDPRTVHFDRTDINYRFVTPNERITIDDRIGGWMIALCRGVSADRREMSFQEFRNAFHTDNLPRFP